MGQTRQAILLHITNCHYCGETVFPSKKAQPSQRTIDHRIPVSRGGKNALSNYVVACHECNWDKRDLTEQEYLAVLKIRSDVGAFPIVPEPHFTPFCTGKHSLMKYLQWSVAPYVNNFRMTLVSASVLFLVHFRKHF